LRWFREGSLVADIMSVINSDVLGLRRSLARPSVRPSFGWSVSTAEAGPRSADEVSFGHTLLVLRHH
jgi:hypothetical protein